MTITKALALALILTYVDASTFSTAINGFSGKSFKEIGTQQAGRSIIISGFSISTAFSFLSAGARGDTQNEITTALGFSSQSDAESSFKTAIANVNSVQGITLNTANKLYLQNSPGIELNPSFKQTAVDVFQSDIEKINFGASSQAVATINAWVAGKTNQKIQQTLLPGDVDGSTTLVLVNVIYFKGFWDAPFDPTLTKKWDFNLNSDDKVQVDMMLRTGKYGFLNKADWDASIIELNYKGNTSSMVIVLPNTVNGLADLENKIVNSDMKQDVFDQITQQTIQVGVPKFKIETTVDLTKVMPELGVKSVFSGGDLSGLLTTNERLYVSAAIHKGFVEVNEEGTEAAAVTALVISRRLPPSIICDRPFIFFIKLATGEILFTGRFTGGSIGPQPIVGTTLPTTTPKPVIKNPWDIDCNRLLPRLRPYCYARKFPNFFKRLPKKQRF